MQEKLFGRLKDVRDCFGLSENGFRLYERAGLMQCRRNVENGYRGMTPAEATRLAGSYGLVRYGLPIKRVNELIDEPLESYADALDELDATLERREREIAASRARLRWQVGCLREYMASPKACEVVSTCAIRFAPLYDESLTFVSRPGKNAQAWYRSLPFVDVAMLVDTSGAVDAREVLFGSSAGPEVAEACALPLEGSFEFCGEGDRCLRGYVCYPSADIPPSSAYEHLTSYMESHGLTARDGRVLHRLLDLSDRNDANRLDEVLIPLSR